ncbi:MAG: DUF349 domain-containing protein [Thermomicrobiales bacterium]
MNGERSAEATASESVEESATAFDGPTAEEAEAMVTEILGSDETDVVVAAADSSPASSGAMTLEGQAGGDDAGSREVEPEGASIQAEIPEAPAAEEEPVITEGHEQPEDEMPAPDAAVEAAARAGTAEEDAPAVTTAANGSVEDTSHVPAAADTEVTDAHAVAAESGATVAEPEAGPTNGEPADAPAETAPILAADALVAGASVEAEIEQPAADAVIEVASELTWGFIDTEGRVHQKTTERFRGRVIGRIHGGSGEPQIAEYEANFGPLAKEVEVLEGDVTTAKNKVAVLGRVRKMKTTAGRAEALGDFDELFRRLHELETTIQQEIDDRRAAKEALIARAEEMKDSTDWKVTGEAYKELFQEWKQVGATGREADDSLWARFIAARELFNTRRSEHFNQRQEQWEGNRLLKQDLIVRAHELSTSDQWRPTSDALRALFDEWKKIGSAGRQSDEELWQQFRGAQQHFYDRRSAAWDDARQRKEALCQRAEDLRESTDWEATVDEMKAMMADWKTIGTSGKRDVDDALWNRFRSAQNAFFDKRYAEASAREQEERSKMQRKDEITTSIEALAYSSDAVAAAEQAAALRAEFDALPPLRKDREEGLQRRIRKAMGDIRVNAAAEGARRAVSWQGKLREALERSQDQIEGLEQSIKTQESQLADLRANLSSAPSEEKDDLERQIQELNESLSYNQAEVDRLRGSMTDIEASVS